MLSCRQTFAGAQLAVGVQAGQLGAGAGAARRAVIRVAGAQHKAAAVGAVTLGRTVRCGRLGAPSAPVMPARDRAHLHALGVARQRWRCCSRSVCPCSLTRKNQLPPHATSPVTVPRPSTSTLTDFEMTVARHVAHRHAVRVEASQAFRRSPRAKQAGEVGPCSVASTMPTGVSMRCAPAPSLPMIRQRRHQPDRAVPAHAEIADVVEEDHAGRAGSGRPVRTAVRRRSHRCRAAR